MGAARERGARIASPPLISMSSGMSEIAKQRAIIDRRALASAVAEAVAADGMPGARRKVVELLRGALEAGRAELARRHAEAPSAGLESAAGRAATGEESIMALKERRTMARLFDKSIAFG